MLTHSPPPHASAPLFLLTKWDIRPPGKFFTNAYCIHVCSTHHVSSIIYIGRLAFPFRKLETDVSAKLITVLLYVCVEFKELPSVD